MNECADENTTILAELNEINNHFIAIFDLKPTTTLARELRAICLRSLWSDLAALSAERDSMIRKAQYIYHGLGTTSRSGKRPLPWKIVKRRTKKEKP